MRNTSNYAILKYQTVVDFKKKYPHVRWSDICKKFKVNYYACRSYWRTRKIKIPGSRTVPISYLNEHPDRWKREYHKAWMRNYFKTKWRKKKILYDNLYKSRNLEAYRSYAKKHARKCISSLSDSYIKLCLFRNRHHSEIEIPKSIILAKREQLKLIRKVKEIENSK